MAPSRSRQRKLAREKYQRQLVRRAQQQRRRRQVQAGIGAFVTLVVIAVGSAWLLGVFEPEEEPFVADTCTWLPQDTAANPDRIEVGTPDANPPMEGVRTMIVDLDAGQAGTGQVEVVLDLAAAPCATASFEYLAAQGFYDGTICHELLDGVALRCGDPIGTGFGGPTYAYFDENLPSVPADEPDEETNPDETGEKETGPEEAEEGQTNGDADEEPPVLYQRGTVAVGDTTGQHGSQFLVFFDDYTTVTPLYSIVGTVTGGLDLLDAIGEAGTAEDDAEASTGTPAEEVHIQTLTVVNPDATGDEAGDQS